jgi:hypothetical protein
MVVASSSVVRQSDIKLQCRRNKAAADIQLQINFGRERCIDLAARCYLSIVAKRETGKLKSGEMRNILKAVGEFDIKSWMIHNRLKQIRAGNRINDILTADWIHVNRAVLVPSDEDSESIVSDLSSDEAMEDWNTRERRQGAPETLPVTPHMAQERFTVPHNIEFRA